MKQVVINSEDLPQYLEKGYIARSTYEHAGVQCGYIVEKVDNPVPSLDIIKLKNQYYKENPRLHMSHTVAIDLFSSWLKQEIIIQNGVETNKERPENKSEELHKIYRRGFDLG